MDSNLTLEWAIHYADHGYRVIPIKPAEKRPPIAAWQDHATCNTGTITQWFTQTYPDHGIGIVTGENNYGQRFIVLDIDTKDDNAGAKTIQHLQTLHYYWQTTGSHTTSMDKAPTTGHAPQNQPKMANPQQ